MMNDETSGELKIQFNAALLCCRCTLKPPKLFTEKVVLSECLGGFVDPRALTVITKAKTTDNVVFIRIGVWGAKYKIKPLAK